uniref:Integrase, catalytic region, zinc finger, CCHC-type, peptidase aspartic, catalytic n=1 Tax=Tanacetum cinerariifolium TaxID=118510 RepID=A0A6L2M7X9_TANCI|nr:hypothetical protein [Tanacetum cinerariifolium]
MTTLTEHIIIAGAENHPPMLEKSMYHSRVIHIRLFIKGKKHGSMMLDSIDNGPLVYLTIEENRQTRPKKYSKLTKAQQLQDDYDVQATNIILYSLPPDVYSLVNHQEQPFKMAESQFNKFKEDNLRVFLALEIEELLQLQEEIMQLTLEYQKLQLLSKQSLRIQPLHTKDLDAYDSDCNDLSSAKAVPMANLSSCDSDVLSEVPYSDSSPNDMINLDAQDIEYSEQTHFDNFQDNEIHSDSNIIMYSQYLQE